MNSETCNDLGEIKRLLPIRAKNSAEKAAARNIQQQVAAASTSVPETFRTLFSFRAAKVFPAIREGVETLSRFPSPARGNFHSACVARVDKIFQEQTILRKLCCSCTFAFKKVQCDA